MVFQFPTGWNSTLCHIQDEYLAPVSIPNGMEFYHRHGFYHLFLLSFQFPTGWNSTPFPPALKPRKHSFNSQRDGILHSPSVPKSCPVTRFQFPTGWNSTCPLSFAPPSLNFRFNSQRDGILLVLPLAQVELPPFQFPTGWNSTVLGIFLAISKIKVSIPNGMEFYSASKATPGKPWAVSIPNGMEFYYLHGFFVVCLVSVSIPNGMEFYDHLV